MPVSYLSFIDKTFSNSQLTFVKDRLCDYYDPHFIHNHNYYKYYNTSSCSDNFVKKYAEAKAQNIILVRKSRKKKSHRKVT